MGFLVVLQIQPAAERRRNPHFVFNLRGCIVLPLDSRATDIKCLWERDKDALQAYVGWERLLWAPRHQNHQLELVSSGFHGGWWRWLYRETVFSLGLTPLHHTCCPPYSTMTLFPDHQVRWQGDRDVLVLCPTSSSWKESVT